MEPCVHHAYRCLRQSVISQYMLLVSRARSQLEVAHPDMVAADTLVVGERHDVWVGCVCLRSTRLAISQCSEKFREILDELGR